MMRFAWGILGLLLLQSPAFAEEDEAPAKSHLALCPADSSGGPEAVLTFPASGRNPRLIVCSEVELDSEYGAKTIDLTAFRILSGSGAKFTNTVFQNRDELDRYSLRVTENGIRVTENVLVDERLVSFLEFSVICKGSACSRTNKKCALPKLKADPYPAIVGAFSARLTSGSDDETQAPMDTLIAQLFSQAMSGDKKARALIDDQKKALAKLEGPAVEAFQRAHALLKRARQFGCF